MKQYNHIYTSRDDFKSFVATQKIDTNGSAVLIQIFTSLTEIERIKNIASEITQIFPYATLIGSSAAGEIMEAQMLEDSTVVSISVFEKSKISAYHMRGKDSYELGLSLSKKIFNKNTKCVISFLDGLLHNGQEFLDGLSAMNFNDAVISGGMAADGLSFDKTYTIYGTKVFSGGAVCVALEGESLVVQEDYNLGWRAVGPTFSITKSDGARVYEIDNRPVKDVYEEVLGSFAVENMPASTIEFPLIRQEGNMLIARSMLHIYDDGSILYGGNLAEGEEVRFGIGSRTLVNQYNPKETLHTLQEQMQACFIYSCIARKQFLGEELEKSFRVVENIAPSIGFFTYGEFFYNNKKSKLLNVTTTLLFLKERGTQKAAESSQKSVNIQNYSKTDSALFNLIEYITSELKKQEKSFRASKFKLDEFLKALDSVVIISRTNTEGVITYVNERFEEISGYSKDELLGEPHSIVRNPEVAAEVFKEFWDEIKKGKIWRGEFSNRAKDGRIYHVKSSIIPIHDENNNIIEYMAIREDVTSLVESRKKAEKAEIAQSMFLANMSHEIRTPMNGILGFSELLAKTNLDDTQEKYIKVISSSTKLLLNIVNDVLDSSKLSNQKIKLEHLPLNPFDEFSTTFELLKSSAKEKNIDYTLEIDNAISSCILGDSMRLRQIMSNLLSNAIKFTLRGGKVHFTISLLESLDTKQKIKFSVKDSGIGIAKSKLKTIFEPFSQADISTTRKFGGTGLGLTISSDLIKVFGSELKVISKETKGSQFFFNIEFERCAQSELNVESNESRVCKNEEDCNKFYLNILVVEDYEVNRMLIESLFDKYKNIKLTFAVNGEEAIEEIQKSQFDLVLMDINMPVMNGIEATRIIREKLHLDIPIVALTANVIQGDRERFLAEGMDDYLSKPIELEKLKKILCTYAGEEKTHLMSVNLTDMLEIIESKIGIGESMALKLLGTFSQSMREILPQLQEAIKEKNLDDIYELSHKLKGAAGTLYIEDVYNLFKLIETEALNKIVPDYLSELDNLYDYIEKLESEVSHYH